MIWTRLHSYTGPSVKDLYVPLMLAPHRVADRDDTAFNEITMQLASIYRDEEEGGRILRRVSLATHTVRWASTKRCAICLVCIAWFAKQKPRVYAYVGRVWNSFWMKPIYRRTKQLSGYYLARANDDGPPRVNYANYIVRALWWTAGNVSLYTRNVNAVRFNWNIFGTIFSDVSRLWCARFVVGADNWITNWPNCER